MCGIAGAIWLQDGVPLSESVLRQMAKVIEHRGPDGEGFHYEQNASGGVALAHRRLSIIDLAGGKQPMCNEDETIWITFTCELSCDRINSAKITIKSITDTENLTKVFENSP